ncbi:CpsB/CapC family capsule biosynthesis tyrosine phosphatase [Clostridium sp. C8-1-8]|uniref:tyrosine-protein phosphatase n=1 Tax=Clostridium sp. C8-1-8 TaxID=2698831 RepID=UPI001367F544|nr:CpsB/CapC family capsule biosynthesis tyrosine phosphatase [Clostridium sp. C8-1-8]
MIDFHSHIIPNVDDGSQSFEITKDMIRNSISQGVTHICATSHYIPGEFEQEKNNYDNIFSEVSDFGKQEGIKVIKGLEVYITPNLVDLYSDGLIWCINNKKYMLIELPMREFPLYTEDVFYELRLKGVTPILAHPERNFKIANNIELLKNLVEQGNLAQVNSGSLTGAYGNTIKGVAEQLVARNLVHMVGSDGHNNEKRNTYIDKAYEVIKEVNIELYKWIESNELSILNGEEVNPLVIREPKKQGLLSRLFKKK